VPEKAVVYWKLAVWNWQYIIMGLAVYEMAEQKK
jgi:hypothetical protein